MKLTVEFPSVVHRDGPSEIARLAQAIEEIGFDEIDIFDHVINGYPIPGRDPAPYPATMPLLEALVTLGYIAAVTERVGLGTEVLVLPQRQPVLAAKQFSTIDTLSGGRLRVGVGVGWQESEYDALGMDFHTRGRAMDEAIALMQACWRDETIDFAGDHFSAESMAMEPKPPQGGEHGCVGGREVRRIEALHIARNEKGGLGTCVICGAVYGDDVIIQGP